MIIRSIQINNYRSLDGVSLSFDQQANYIIGRNNVGKTSILELVNTIVNGRQFSESDFFDINTEIKIILTLELDNLEVGLFDDNFSKDSENQVCLQFCQLDPDTKMEVTVENSDTSIPLSQLKLTNFISFTSNRSPVKESELTRDFGKYRLIPLLINKYLENNTPNNLDVNEYDTKIITFINDWIDKIKPFHDNNLRLEMAADYHDYITRSLRLLGQGSVNFEKMGFGTQFSSLIPLEIIDKIVYWSRYGHLNEHTIDTSDGKKELHIVLGLDEPEVHLHPNLQLSEMEDIKSLLLGNDFEFNALLKYLFDVDTIKGQLIVVTHSPEILSTNYKEFIRLSKSGDQLDAHSGSEIELNLQLKKHLFSKLSYIKAAFFADKVLVCEGYSEVGALTVFAERMNVSFVRNNINIINSQGVQNVEPLQELLDKFGITNYAIVDSDNNRQSNPRMIVTQAEGFETECFNEMTLSNINQYLHDVENDLRGNNYDGLYLGNFLKFYNGNKDIHEELIELNGADSELIVQIINSKINELSEQEQNVIKNKIQNEKDFIKKYMKKQKSEIHGEIIARNTTNIPDSYKKSIEKIANLNVEE